MVQLNSKKGFGVTYSTGRYEEYEALVCVVYAEGNDVFSLIWSDGDVQERDTECYWSIQSLDNGSIIEF